MTSVKYTFIFPEVKYPFKSIVLMLVLVPQASVNLILITTH